MGATGLPEDIERFARHAFGSFDFSGIEPRLPTVSFRSEHELDVAGRRVELIELGPAHTPGDAIAHVPDAGVVFTGDLLFIEGTPIMWAGPVSSWLNACDRIIELEARILVPGHGPVTDHSGVRDVQRYLRYVYDQSRASASRPGWMPRPRPLDIDISDFRDWGDPERIAVNVATVYRELDPHQPAVSPPELFARMGRWLARHGGIAAWPAQAAALSCCRCPGRLPARPRIRSAARSAIMIVGSVGVAAHERRHDRGVDHAQPLACPRPSAPRPPPSPSRTCPPGDRAWWCCARCG